VFNCSTIFLIDRLDKIYKLEIDNETQKAINKLFEKSALELKEKQSVEFTGSYSPLEDEILYIQNFILSDSLKDAFRNPITAESFIPDENNIHEIKSVCIGYCENTCNGERFIAGFQRFRKDQYISIDKIRLLFDSNTFRQDNRIGIAISDYIDCLYDGTNLIFSSYYYARQIFDLSEYYRTASDVDLDNFVNCKIIELGTFKQLFKNTANSWVRRKIALINDSGVLEKYKAKDIKKIAKQQSDIDINVENDKIIFPTNANEIKILLGFLDEEAYRGPFSKSIFLSNSKRRVKK